MDKIDFREKIMLCCIMVLVLVLSSILLRLGTRQVLVKKMRMDNGFTRMVLFDAPNLQNKAESKVKAVVINWAEKYPFDGQKVEHGKLVTFMQQTSDLKALVKDLEEEKVEPWCKDHLAFYSRLVEAGRSIDNVLAWEVINSDTNVYKLRDGYWTYCYKKMNMAEHIIVVVDFADFVRQQGASCFMCNRQARAILLETENLRDWIILIKMQICFYRDYRNTM